MLVILAWLTIVAGRSNREEGIVLNRVDKMKTESKSYLRCILLINLALLIKVILDWIGSIYREHAFVIIHPHIATDQ